jgi:hypothetical protein
MAFLTISGNFAVRRAPLEVSKYGKARKPVPLSDQELYLILKGHLNPCRESCKKLAEEQATKNLLRAISIP